MAPIRELGGSRAAVVVEAALDMVLCASSATAALPPTRAVEVALDVGLMRGPGGAADHRGGRAVAGPMLVEVGLDVGWYVSLAAVLPPARLVVAACDVSL